MHRYLTFVYFFLTLSLVFVFMFLTSFNDFFNTVNEITEKEFWNIVKRELLMSLSIVSITVVVMWKTIRKSHKKIVELLEASKDDDKPEDENDCRENE